MTKPTAVSLLPELTLEEKTSLLSGSGFWHTTRIDRVGLASIMVSDLSLIHISEPTRPY